MVIISLVGFENAQETIDCIVKQFRISMSHDQILDEIRFHNYSQSICIDFAGRPKTCIMVGAEVPFKASKVIEAIKQYANHLEIVTYTIYAPVAQG